MTSPDGKGQTGSAQGVKKTKSNTNKHSQKTPHYLQEKQNHFNLEKKGISCSSHLWKDGKLLKNQDLLNGNVLNAIPGLLSQR